MKKNYPVFLSLIIISAIIVFTLMQKSDMPMRMIDRATGLFGYLFLFLAILSSEYMKEMKQLFGKSFIKIHHFLARIAVLLMLVHPVAFALEERSASVFIPVLYPLNRFLELAGRPALYLMLIAVIIAIYRKRFIRQWKKVHYLNYPAFLMIFIHAWLIGTDLNSLIMQVLWLSMAFIVIAVFVHKHLIPERSGK